MANFLDSLSTAINPQVPQEQMQSVEPQMPTKPKTPTEPQPASIAEAAAPATMPAITPEESQAIDQLQLAKSQQEQQHAAAQNLADIDLKQKIAENQLNTQIAANQAAAVINNQKTKEESADADRIQQEIEEEQKRLKNFSIDDIIKNKSTSDKVLANIGIILSGIGSGMTGSNRNLGLEAYNASIDQEFNKQKLGLEERLAGKKHLLNLFNAKVDARMNQAKTDLELQNLGILKQKLANEGAALTQQQLMLKQQALMEEKARKGSMSPNEEAAYVASLSKEDKKRFVPGFGLAKDADTAKKALEQLNVADQAKSQVKEIRNLFKDYGTREILDRGAVAKEQSARRNLQLQLKELFNLGVLNGPDLNLLEEATGGDFFSITTSDAAKEAKLSSIESFINNKLNSSLKTAGLNPAGTSKRDQIISKYKAGGLSDAEAAERYNKLLQKGLLR